MSKLTAATSAPIKQATTQQTGSTVAATKTEAVTTPPPPITHELDLEKLARAKGFAPKGGDQVAKTATNDALWGSPKAPSMQGGGKPPLEIMGLKSLSTQQRTEKMASLQAEKKDLTGRIEKRAEQVEKRWDYSLLKKRGAVLQEYIGKNAVPAEAKTQVEAALAQADAAVKGIDATMEKVKLLGKKGTPTHGTPEERTALCKELLGYRKAQSDAIHTASDVIEKLGLKVDLLAHAEAVIDPTGAQNSEYGSLAVMVNRFYEVMFSIGSLESFGDPLVKALNEGTKHMVEDERKRDLILAQWDKLEEVKGKALATLEFGNAVVAGRKSTTR